MEFDYPLSPSSRDRISAWSKSNSPTYNFLENGRGDRYGYDAEGQLTAASYEALTPSGTPTGAKRTESFAYDALGNRQGSNVVAGRGAVTFYRRDNGLNQYSSWTPSIIYYDDNYPGWGPSGNGVMMAEGWITASYNALNQPVAIWSPAYSGTSNVMYFGFDPLGRCVKRWVGASDAANSNPATYLYYDGWNLIQEGTGAAAAERIYVHGQRVDEIVCHYNYAAAQWRYHHYDARGHCILLTDATGELIEQYEYNAFGRPYFYSAANNWTSDTGSSLFGNRFLFIGREWLSDLKLYDYRNRLYQPELGRFLQPDPKHFVAGDYNLYRYCHNDPVNKTDPTGLATEAEYDVSGGNLSLYNPQGGPGVVFTNLNSGAGLGFVNNPAMQHVVSPDGRSAPAGPIPAGNYLITSRADKYGAPAFRLMPIGSNDSTTKVATPDGRTVTRGLFVIHMGNPGGVGCIVTSAGDKKTMDAIARVIQNNGAIRKKEFLIIGNQKEKLIIYGKLRVR